jgi:hypothetical protein
LKPSSETVGERFASALGEGPGRATLNAQRVQVLEMARRSFSGRARPRLGAAALACLALAGVATALALYLTRERALEARFRGEAIAGYAALAAGGHPSTLEFSDGSEVVLAPDARATLSEISPSQAGLRVEGGSIAASIRKHPGMSWTISAGPYAVHVVGTRFSVDWNAAERALEVVVREGSVRVTGGDLPREGVLVDGGGRLERRPRARVAEQAVEKAAGQASATGNERARAKDPSAEPLPGSGATISVLATKGKYREALALAERQGFERLTNELPENDLLLLANAARYSGDAKRARLALVKLRQRFQGRPAADLAALYLAKVAENMTHEPEEAVRWLRTFLQSSPSGDLAAGARASLMSLLLQSGDQAAARAVARDYLRHHESGPQAAEARAIVRE